MARFEVQVPTRHAVLFLCDSQTTDVPDVDGETFAVATPHAVAFFVLSDVDGTSVVTIANDPPGKVGRRMFAGLLEAPSGVLSLSDSSDFRYLNVPVELGEVAIEIWAEDEVHPEWVHIRLGAIRHV